MPPTQIHWDDTWPKIFDHYQQDQRHAYYVNALLHDEDRRVLELGAGSFRDMALLNRLGVNCWGADYSSASVELARRQFPELAAQIFQGDAFQLDGMADAAFDVSFHNGLWVLFDDQDIRRLAAEQARVSRRKIIATVHNAHNPDFIDYFARLGETDPLYRIRFFEAEEMRALLAPVCRSVEIVPVGKGKKHLEDELINQGKTSRAEMRTFFDQAGMDHLRNSERLLCIGHL
ncbi:class I SAM-dependent methyltransferase [Paucibacter sp. DJ1R-11]|uniref:class I SAM-dependent methyltransferase n=1 Tax=Paucibacter sp. DJ1R-11 TaxID=2893556 RepID=UPI0021E3F8ED|nr:class I SAM-dependent methyltransferase [Paucibacter sp. DJ1R-11]MCV2364656.1 class I SAM-dependent methyltransferase [Paucibacter sp. DJ1R-11]